MSIIHRHLLFTFFRNLAFTMVGALVLFTLIDLLDHIGSLVDNEASAWQILRYYTFKAVWIVDTVLPIAMLMATLFTVGTMARYLELTALFAAGWSLMKTTRPLILLAILAYWYHRAHDFAIPRRIVVWRKLRNKRREEARRDREKRRALKKAGQI